MNDHATTFRLAGLSLVTVVMFLVGVFAQPQLAWAVVAGLVIGGLLGAAYALWIIHPSPSRDRRKAR